MEAAERRHEITVAEELSQELDRALARETAAKDRIDALTVALRPIFIAYRERVDPGTYDLDNEQPFHITVALGDLRRLAGLL